MSLDAYITREAIDDEPRWANADLCDSCRLPLIARRIPGACQCPDDEAPECASCHEEPATTGFRLCPGCSRVVRNSREIALQAEYQRLGIAGTFADGTTR